MSAAVDPVPRVVLDTNVLVSALIFSEGKLAALRMAWQARRYVPVASRETVEELARVLSYGKFRLSPQEGQELMADFLPFIETHVIADQGRKRMAPPACRDPNDQKFLDLAFSARVQFLVTGDRDLLVLADELPRRSPCKIVTPQEFLKLLTEAASAGLH